MSETPNAFLIQRATAEIQRSVISPDIFDQAYERWLISLFLWKQCNVHLQRVAANSLFEGHPSLLYQILTLCSICQLHMVMKNFGFWSTYFHYTFQRKKNSPEVSELNFSCFYPKRKHAEQSYLQTVCVWTNVVNVAKQITESFRILKNWDTF